jgi:hypothetical protein
MSIADLLNSKFSPPYAYLATIENTSYYEEIKLMMDLYNKIFNYWTGVVLHNKLDSKHAEQFATYIKNNVSLTQEENKIYVFHPVMAIENKFDLQIKNTIDFLYSLCEKILTNNFKTIELERGLLDEIKKSFENRKEMPCARNSS